MPKTKSRNSADKTPANKQKGKKICTCCHKEKRMPEFYLSYSPMYSLDERVPVCKECCKNSCLNDDGSIDFEKLKELLRNIDKPLYYDLISSAEESIKKENSYLSDEDLQFKGYDILSKYFTLVAMRQDRAKSYSDSEKEGFMHQNSNRKKDEKHNISKKYSNIIENDVAKLKEENIEDFIYDDIWMGKYTQKDIAYLNKYYAGLERDYKIITENHRDYARKIAKASLQMDKAFDEMINGIDGADARYKNAREAFDTLSKSAKFSESTRSVNDVGISSF